MQLLIPAKIPQCLAHMCGTLCTHLAARLTPPLATALWSFKHTYMFVSQQQQHRKETGKGHPGVYCTDSGRTASEQYLVCNGSSTNKWGSGLGPGPKAGLTEILCEAKERLKSEVPLCRNEDNFSGDFFFFSQTLCESKPWWKELLQWLSMERFPGMLDRVSGMYRFNEPIWKLTEMKREPYGHITHRITTWASAGGRGGPLEFPVSGLSTFQTKTLASLQF